MIYVAVCKSDLQYQDKYSLHSVQFWNGRTAALHMGIKHFNENVYRRNNLVPATFPKSVIWCWCYRCVNAKNPNDKNKLHESTKTVNAGKKNIVSYGLHLALVYKDLNHAVNMRYTNTLANLCQIDGKLQRYLKHDRTEEKWVLVARHSTQKRHKYHPTSMLRCILPRS